MRMGESGIGGGSINGLLEPALDAWSVHWFVRAWLDPAPGWADRVAVAAECNVPPVVPAKVPRMRVVPVFNGRGEVKQYYTQSGRRAYMCPVAYIGTPAAEIEAYRIGHHLFLAMLDRMVQLGLSEWIVTKRGLTECGESLTRGSILNELRPVA